LQFALRVAYFLDSFHQTAPEHGTVYFMASFLFFKNDFPQLEVRNPVRLYHD